MEHTATPAPPVLMVMMDDADGHRGKKTATVAFTDNISQFNYTRQGKQHPLFARGSHSRGVEKTSDVSHCLYFVSFAFTSSQKAQTLIEFINVLTSYILHSFLFIFHSRIKVELWTRGPIIQLMLMLPTKSIHPSSPLTSTGRYSQLWVAVNTHHAKVNRETSIPLHRTRSMITSST